MSTMQIRTLLFALLALLVAGCSTPVTLDAQWVNPEFAGKHPIRNVMVMAAVRDATLRRLTEDRMTAALTAAGVKAVQSYRFIPADGPVSEDALRRAVGEAGVNFAMVSRVINVSTQVNVSPGMVMGPAWGPGWGWGAGWGGGWGGFAGYYNAIPPTVTTTQNVHVDTRAFETKNAAVVWSAATTTSTGYNTTQELVDHFVQLIVATMAKDGII